MKKYLILIFMFFNFNIFADRSDSDIHKYVETLIQDGLTILHNQNLSQAQKVVETKKLILQNMDLKWMAKFTLGSFRTELDTNKIEEFTEVYSDYVGRVYSDLVKAYKGQDPVLTSIKNIDSINYSVNMKIGDIDVCYLVKKYDQNTLKVADVITAGVSLINSQRSEFTSVISSNKNGIDVLINKLSQKSAIKK